MKHIIGIDFGTSTSMIKVAARDGSSSLETKEVKFTQYGIGSTPTLIRKKDGGVVWYGQDAAQNERMDTVLHRNFKLNLKSEDPAKQQEAVELLEEFYRFLYKTYSEQKNFLIGTDGGEVETVVSYPAQWGKEQQEAVINAARKAGFPNVTGMDEPTAAVICVLKAKQKELEDSGLLRAGKPLNILIVDMGAGTTDLAFVTVTVENGTIQANIKETWPKTGSAQIYGGSQMDLRLEAIIENWLAGSDIEPKMIKDLIKGQRNNIKSWKEYTLSALLEKNWTVDGFSSISNMLTTMGMQVNPFPAINRETFADHFRTELESFVDVIASAPQNLRDETELVILTGGNSVWYWVPDVMLGKDTRFGNVSLKNISSPVRLLRMEQPADTVSRGLVYDKANFLLRKPMIKISFIVPPENTYKTLSRIAMDAFTLALPEIYRSRNVFIDGEKYIIFPDSDSYIYPKSKGVYKDHLVQIIKGEGINGAGYMEVNPGSHTVSIRSGIIELELMSCTIELNENENLIVNCATCEYRTENALKSYAQTQHDEIVASGMCGENAFWTLYKGGALEIAGNGKMLDYNFRGLGSLKMNTPWYDYRKQIKEITVKDDITRIGEFAFAEIDGATIFIPASVTAIGDWALRNVKEIYFLGDKPAFEGNPFATTIHTDCYYLESASGWDQDDLPKDKKLTWNKIQ